MIMYNINSYADAMKIHLDIATELDIIIVKRVLVV